MSLFDRLTQLENDLQEIEMLQRDYETAKTLREMLLDDVEEYD